MTRGTNGAQGWFWGFWGVVGFSLTLPATQMAVAGLGPTLVGLGRAVAAAGVALIILAIRRDRFPREVAGRLLVVMVGVVLGFPWLTAWAMARVPATHGAVMLALLPLATAAAGAWRVHERPTWSFWVASGIASTSIIGYALVTGAGHLVPADGALIGAVALAALGFAEGGRLAQSLGGWRVICWALVLSLPVTLGPVTVDALRIHWASITPAAWVSFAYLSLGSSLVAFFAWYHGLAVGGVARVGQLQYLQVFLTLGWSAWWLHEPVTWATTVSALAVVGAVVWGQRARFASNAPADFLSRQSMSQD